MFGCAAAQLLTLTQPPGVASIDEGRHQRHRQGHGGPLHPGHTRPRLPRHPPPRVQLRSTCLRTTTTRGSLGQSLRSATFRCSARRQNPTFRISCSEPTDNRRRGKAEEQKAFGVPEEFLNGHAWHTYTLTSSDGSVQFEFKHNVCGRRTYGEGVADTVSFLAATIAQGPEKKIYDMIDVLSAGAMK